MLIKYLEWTVCKWSCCLSQSCKGTFFFLDLNNNVLRGNMGSFFSVDIGTRLYRDLLLFQFCEVCFTKFIVIGKSGLQILTKLRLTSFSDPPKTPEDVWCSEQYFFSWVLNWLYIWDLSFLIEIQIYCCLCHGHNYVFCNLVSVLKPEVDPAPCQNTRCSFPVHGRTWAETKFTVEQIQRFYLSSARMAGT